MSMSRREWTGWPLALPLSCRPLNQTNERSKQEEGSMSQGKEVQGTHRHGCGSQRGGVFVPPKQRHEQPRRQEANLLIDGSVMHRNQVHLPRKISQPPSWSLSLPLLSSRRAGKHVRLIKRSKEEEREEGKGCRSGRQSRDKVQLIRRRETCACGEIRADACMHEQQQRLLHSHSPTRDASLDSRICRSEEREWRQTTSGQ